VTAIARYKQILNSSEDDQVKAWILFLQKKWKEHREMAKQFTVSSSAALTSEQLEILRSLGYVR